MSPKEIYTDGAEDERGSGRRFAITLGVVIVLLFALTVWGLLAIFNGKLRHNAPEKSVTPAASSAASENYKWKITGALTEACSVPCAGNEKLTG